MSHDRRQDDEDRERSDSAVSAAVAPAHWQHRDAAAEQAAHALFLRGRADKPSQAPDWRPGDYGEASAIEAPKTIWGAFAEARAKPPSLERVGQSRPMDPLGQSFADESRDADHDGRANPFTTPRGKQPPGADRATQLADHAGADGSPHGRRLADAATGATADLELVINSLLASFATARDGLYPDAAEQLAGNIIGKLASAVATRDEIAAVVDPNHPGYAAHHVLPTTAAQGVDLGHLMPLWSYLGILLPIAEQQSADELGPHRFNGAAVMAGAQPRSIGSNAAVALGRIRAEAQHTVELVAIVAQVRDQFLAVDGILSPDLERKIAAQLAPLASRPVHFAFVKAALVDFGIWPYLEHATRKADPRAIADRSPWEQFTNNMTDDRTLADVDRDATKQAQTFGAMVELGAFDQDAAISLLERNTWITYLDRAQSIISRRADTGDAMKVLEMLRALDKPARAAVLEHLSRAGVLDLLAGGLPFSLVEQLSNELPPGFTRVSSELAPFYQHRDKSDHTLGHLIDQVPLIGGALEEVANVATFGFLHEHDRARRAADQGLITGEDYAASAGKAAARAGAIAVLSTATGGVAGTYAQGATAGLAELGTAGRIAAGTLTGAAAGAAGNVGARAGSDLVDWELSSFDTYATDAITGAAIGGAIGGGTATIGEAGAAFLPDGIKARFQHLAERFPNLAPESEIAMAIRQLGARHSQGVARFAISTVELGTAARAGVVSLSEEVTAFLGNLDGAAPQLAPVGASGTSRPIRLTVDATAAQPLHAPGTLDGPALHVMHAERLGDDLGSRPSGDLASHLGEGPETTGGMHIIDGAADAERTHHATASATRSNIGSRTPLAEHIPPPGPEFVVWFDSLTLKELEEFLSNRSRNGLKGAREVIADNIRHPGGLHEWLMVKQQIQIKKWGVSLQTVMDARTSTEATIGRHFKHGSTGSTTMHRELDRMIDTSPNFEAFKQRLNEWADRELFSVRGPSGEPAAGRYYLPPELQVPTR